MLLYQRQLLNLHSKQHSFTSQRPKSMTLETPSSSSSNLNNNVSTILTHYVFGPVPSKSEVDFAISLLQNFVVYVSSDGEESKWVLQMLESPTSKLLVSLGLQRLYKAFNLWQIDPFVKSLVASLASDEAVWDAIMNNTSVRELQKPLLLDGNGKEWRRDCGNERAKLAALVVKQIWESLKSNVAELVDNFRALMRKMFPKRDFKNEKLSRKEDCDDDEQLKERVESSLLLAVLIILIVLVVRATGV